MIRRREYRCAEGCCEVRLVTKIGNGGYTVLTLNGVQGNYEFHAARLNRKLSTLKNRAVAGLCLQQDLARANRKTRERIAQKSTAALCNTFAALRVVRS